MCYLLVLLFQNAALAERFGHCHILGKCFILLRTQRLFSLQKRAKNGMASLSRWFRLPGWWHIFPRPVPTAPAVSKSSPPLVPYVFEDTGPVYKTPLVTTLPSPPTPNYLSSLHLGHIRYPCPLHSQRSLDFLRHT